MAVAEDGLSIDGQTKPVSTRFRRVKGDNVGNDADVLYLKMYLY